MIKGAHSSVTKRWGADSCFGQAQIVILLSPDHPLGTLADLGPHPTPPHSPPTYPPPRSDLLERAISLVSAQRAWFDATRKDQLRLALASLLSRTGRPGEAMDYVKAVVSKWPHRWAWAGESGCGWV